MAPPTLKLQAKAKADPVTVAAAEMFDIKFDGRTSTELSVPHPLPKQYTCGLIVGPSGSGKTSLLRKLSRSLLQPGAGARRAAHAAAARCCLSGSWASPLAWRSWRAC